MATTRVWNTDDGTYWSSDTAQLTPSAKQPATERETAYWDLRQCSTSTKVLHCRRRNDVISPNPACRPRQLMLTSCSGTPKKLRLVGINLLSWRRLDFTQLCTPCMYADRRSCRSWMACGRHDPARSAYHLRKDDGKNHVAESAQWDQQHTQLLNWRGCSKLMGPLWNSVPLWQQKICNFLTNWHMILMSRLMSAWMDHILLCQVC